MIDGLGRLMWGTPRRAAATATAVAVLLLWATATFPEITAFARWILVGSPIAVLAAAFPNHTKQVAARVLGRLAAASQRIELEAIRQDLEGTLGLAVTRVTAGWPGGAVCDVRIDFIRSGADVERLPDGSLVVGVASHIHRTRNLVAAAWGWARHAVVPDARPFLDRDVSEGLDFVIARSVLHEVGGEAGAEFLRSIWSPAVAGRKRLREITNRLQRVEEHKLLGPIAISEFLELSPRMGARFPSDELFDETARFVDYLFELAVRPPGKDVGDLANFGGNVIRCRVVMVARPEVYSIKGPTPYRRAVDWAIERAYHSVYLLAAGRNSDLLMEVLEPLRVDPRVRAIKEFQSSRTATTGRVLDQVVAYVAVAVHYRVGFGQRPLVAVGPGPAREMSHVRSGRRVG